MARTDHCPIVSSTRSWKCVEVLIRRGDGIVVPHCSTPSCDLQSRPSQVKETCTGSVMAMVSKFSIRETKGHPVLPEERQGQTEMAPSLLLHDGPAADSRVLAVVCNPEIHPWVIRGYSHEAESSSRWSVVPRH